MNNSRLHLQYNAPVVLTFALLALGAVWLHGATGGTSTTRFFCVYRAPLTDPLTYVRFFGHVLGHADWSHYMSNMLLLLLVGPALEEKYGSRRLLMTIAATALITGLVQFICFPDHALLGASGIVFMMIVLNSFTEMKRGGIPLTLILVVILYLGGEIVDGLFTAERNGKLLVMNYSGHDIERTFTKPDGTKLEKNVKDLEIAEYEL